MNLKEQIPKKKPKSNKKTENKSEIKASKTHDKKQSKKSEIKSQEWQMAEHQSVSAPLQALEEMTGDITAAGQKRKVSCLLFKEIQTVIFIFYMCLTIYRNKSVDLFKNW